MSIIEPNLERDYTKVSSKVSEKNVIVTGAANGLGKELVLELLDHGATILAADIDEKGLSKLTKHPRLFTKQVDVTNYRNQLSLFRYAREVLGRIDIVYANAAVGNSPDYTSDINDEIEPDLRVVDINVKGVLYTTHLAVKAFREDKRDNIAQDQCIVLTGSFTSFLSTPAYPAPYAASKHAVWSMMRSLATQGEVEGFRANIICPWFAPTAMVIPSVRLLLTGVGMAKVESMIRAFVMAGSDPSLSGNGFVIDTNGLFIIPATLIDAQCAIAFRQRFINVLKIQNTLRTYHTPIRFIGSLLGAIGVLMGVSFATSYLNIKII
ncbi:NAD(P)-binding protein [Wallemia mellicola]|nr:NAD(P)-binding protein [Wallemia mellicola]